jgi:hypothetical protein
MTASDVMEKLLRFTVLTGDSSPIAIRAQG